MNRWRHWIETKHYGFNRPVAAVSAIVFVCGLLWQQPALLGLGAVLVCLVLRRVGTGDQSDAPAGTTKRTERTVAQYHARTSDDQAAAHNSEGPRATRTLEKTHGGDAPKSMDTLVDELLAEQSLRAAVAAGDKAASHASGGDASDPAAR